MRAPTSVWDRVALARATRNYIPWWRAKPRFPCGDIRRPPAWLGGRAWWRRGRGLGLLLNIMVAVAFCSLVLAFGLDASPVQMHSALLLFWAGMFVWAWFKVEPRMLIFRRARTRDFDWARQQGAATDPALAKSVREELALRRQRWIDQHRSTRGTATFIWLDRRARIAWCLSMGALSFLFLGELIMRKTSLLSTCLSPVVQFGALGYALNRFGSVNRTLFQSMEKRRCPDCGYDLSAVSLAIPDEGDVSSGPAQCPECGVPWPLIPGPVVD